MQAPRGSAAHRTAEVVRVLASVPRPAGGQAEASARAYCAGRLREAGFDVREEPFEYSAFVGRWGTPVAGVVALATLLVAARAGANGSPAFSLALLALGGVALGLVARTLARNGVLSFPAQRSRSVNLVATRGGPTPRVWLMAHLDSKSQPVPILVRAAGITVLGITWVVALLVAAWSVAGGANAPSSIAWTVVTGAAIIGAIPVIATTVGARSPGALDNATGVATVVEAAAQSRAPVGVCLTSGEELGLVGARAWVLGKSGTGCSTINVDSVDDGGATTCMYSGRRPVALVASVLAAAARAGVGVRAHRLLPGVLTDGVALADAGWPVVTLSRGGVRTLARIHTPNDRAEHLTGAGMDEVTRLMVALIDSGT
ncbi:MAG TPA: M28 family peptidase [Gemmatimonadaceae bacterium]|nr:M28 family peptidase [Gemmatimonadaceae bacterium]